MNIIDKCTGMISLEDSLQTKPWQCVQFDSPEEYEVFTSYAIDLSHAFFMNVAETPIAEDGTFTISLYTGFDWVFTGLQIPEKSVSGLSKHLQVWDWDALLPSRLPSQNVDYLYKPDILPIGADMVVGTNVSSSYGQVRIFKNAILFGDRRTALCQAIKLKSSEKHLIVPNIANSSSSSNGSIDITFTLEEEQQKKTCSINYDHTFTSMCTGQTKNLFDWAYNRDYARNISCNIPVYKAVEDRYSQASFLEKAEAYMAYYVGTGYIPVNFLEGLILNENEDVLSLRLQQDLDMAVLLMTFPPTFLFCNRKLHTIDSPLAGRAAVIKEELLSDMANHLSKLTKLRWNEQKRFLMYDSKDELFRAYPGFNYFTHLNKLLAVNSVYSSIIPESLLKTFSWEGMLELLQKDFRASCFDILYGMWGFYNDLLLAYWKHETH